MKRTLIPVAVLAVFLIALPASGAVMNVDLQPVGESEVSGTATVITGNIAGPTPITMMELNTRLNKMPDEEMVYQAWLVDNESEYKLSLGAFNDQTFSGRQQMNTFATYDAVAISMEPQNDTSPAPTTIVALGSLPGTSVSAEDFQTMAVLPEDEMFQRQIIMQRFNLTAEQLMELRMQGWDYNEIALVANAASRCNRPPAEIASMLMQGQTWQQIAQMCETTVAALLEPVPMEAVAGFVGEVTPGMPTTARVFYRMYPNNKPVVTQTIWEDYERRGYDWESVAVAANIAAMTGEQLDNLLRMVRIQGRTWRSIALERGLNIDRVLDVSEWPFSRDGEPAMTTTPPPVGVTPPMTEPREPTY